MDRILPYGLLLLVLVVLGSLIRSLSKKLKRKEEELKTIEGEEERMFDYLHHLGLAIGTDMGAMPLYRTIVDGVDTVVRAKGGALYLLDESGGMLQPKFLSENCPPLVAVAEEVWKRAEEDPRAMDSHLRLSQVPAGEGVFGEALASGEALHIRDLKSHGAFRDAFLGFDEGEVSALVSPLRHGGKDLGVLAVVRGVNDGGFSDNDVAVFRAAAEQSAFALGNALIYREAHEKRKIESELRNASEVQRVLLPQEEPLVPGYRIFGTNVPARIISGDYYDYLDLENGLHGMVIADVSGKGVAAGLLMAMCRSVLRLQAVGHGNPAEVLGAVNRQLFPDIKEDMFISLYYGVIDGDGGCIRLARAGHDAALLYRAADRSIEELKPRGLALGIDEGDVFERITQVMEIHLGSGDCLLFHTDGVVEAMNAADDEFGMSRLREIFGNSASMGAEAVVTTVQREVSAFVGELPQMDDITLLAIEKR